MRLLRYRNAALFLPCLLLSLVDCFTVGFTGKSKSKSYLSAKKHLPSFDLAAIEAYEAELLAQEAMAAAAAEQESSWNPILEDDEEEDDQMIVSKQSFPVEEDMHDKRIDGVLTSLLEDVSRSTCGSMIDQGLVSVLLKDGREEEVTRKSFKVSVGQTIQVLQQQSRNVETDRIVPEDIPLDVIWEDEHMIVINKAANMVVHPAAGNWDGTVCHAMAHYLMHTSPYNSTALEEFEDSLRPGIVHRLDKGTTGVLVVAKSPTILAALSAQFANRTVQKTYLTIAVGNPGKQAIIDKPIGRHPINRQKMRVDPDGGRRALSRVDTLAFNGQLALARVQIATGRTHQIRVHLQDRHTPVCGDDVYGLKDWNKKVVQRYGVRRPLLHAFQLKLEHPVTREPLTFQAPLPPDMRTMIRTIDVDLAESLP